MEFAKLSIDGRPAGQGGKNSVLQCLLQHVAACCGVLQCVTARYSVQHVTVCCSMLVCCSVLHSVVACCSVLQYVSVKVKFK